MKKKTNYLLKMDGDKFTTEEQSPFKMPKVIYGGLLDKSNRILDTYKDRDANLGVLLSGIKGNSKTTTAKMICIESGLPVLLITEPFVGSEFKGFLASQKQEMVVFIDEFEKVYNTTELQQEFLTILDGVFQSKKLFIFTSNSEQINEFLRNRPSRIFYHFKFDNLEKAIVDDIIFHELDDKQFEADLRAVLLILGAISVDVLLNLIGEVNRFKQSPKVLVKGLNIEVEQVNFNVHLFKGGNMYQTKCDFNPLTQDYFVINYKDEKGYYGWHTGNFSDYVMYTKDGTFVFENKDFKMIFTPFKPAKFEL